MPEIAEVETIKRDLEELLINKKIIDIYLTTKAKVWPNKKLFKKCLLKQEIISLHRRAKLLYFKLSNNCFLIIHLKMTGQLIFRRGKILVPGGHNDLKTIVKLPNKSTRLYFKFNDNSYLYFNDIRRFGWLKVVNKQDLELILAKYGLEPLADNFIFKDFKNIFSNSKARLKAILLNQAKIAGLGNIYSDESCFLAGIRPDRLANTLNDSELKRLFLAIKKIVKQAIKNRGTSFNNYVDSYGRQGNFISKLKVYGRSGKRCLKCGHKLKTIKLVGRTTVFCPYCQK